MSGSLRIIVSGLVGVYPVGGVAWDYLQYVIGLARLGHDVVYHEDTWRWPYHPAENRYTSDGTYSAGFIRDFFERYARGLPVRWHYLHLRKDHFGMEESQFIEAARAAKLWINVSGGCLIPESLSPRCVKVFLDTDPGYNQLVLKERFAWSENVERWCQTVAAHDLHFTYAERMNRPGCRVPKVGFEWKTTRMPVVLDLWEPKARQAPPPDAPWTTLMTWNAFPGRVVSEGVEYHSKGHEFEKLLDLPRRVGVGLKVGVGGVEPPVQRLRENGWQVADGPAVSRTPESYQEFIAGSRGELSAAKQVYAALKTGWFSCRSACYLAAGRPVVVQDTGFSELLPMGQGMWAFRTADEASRAVRAVEADYARQAAGARAFAETHFDSGKVLTRFLEDAGRG